MIFGKWEVLLVDDEPDVLSMSKLVMRNIDVYGLPIKLHSAQSKAEAIEILKYTPDLMPLTSVAFIDVVMETDTAGLELCQFIREEMDNKITQLFIRTGQPGIAPEREIVDRYDINGYFTKIEATEDKLYTLVKSGVRQYLWSNLSLAGALIVGNAISTLSTKEKLMESLGKTLQDLNAIGETLAASTALKGAVLIDDSMIVGIEWNEKEVVEVKDRLSQLEGISLSRDGDKYVNDGENMLIKVTSQPNRPELNLIFKTTVDPPHSIVDLIYRPWMNVAYMWYLAK